MDNTIYIVMVNMPYVYADTKEEAIKEPRTVKPYGVFTDYNDAIKAMKKAKTELKKFKMYHECDYWFDDKDKTKKALSWEVKIIDRPLNKSAHISNPDDELAGRSGFWITENCYLKNVEETKRYRERKEKAPKIIQEQRDKLKKNGIVHIKKIETYSVTFDNGLQLESYHCGDCCESHWIEFDTLANYNVGSATGKDINIFEQEFDFSNGIKFEKVDNLGVMLIDTQGNKYLVNGYGNNNGYYSTDLSLQLKYYDDLFENGIDIYDYDITECQNIEWC